ncbi:MAG: ECF transporter S component [Lachnospiraceae bacterium]|nr:ECF transporter S component [Lachnospiraceae bacterium]
MKASYTNTQRLVGTALLAALIIVLQTIGSGIHFGPFTPTLSLVPIIIGAVLYGPITGAILGLVFSLVVLVAVISGADVGSAMMFASNPFATVAICLIKGTAAGFLAGLVAKKFAEKNITLGVVLAAIVAPVCNTGLFCIGMFIFFKDLLESWGQAAGFDNIFVYIFMGLIGVNFLVELLIDIVLAPVIIRIIGAIKKN